MYRTAVIDPPWNYNDQGGRHGIPYSGMTLEKLRHLPVSSWLEDDAHVYVWVTNAFMREAHELVSAWGFDQKTILTWVKYPPGGNWLGMGRYYRNVTEHVLFCVKGKLPIQEKDQPNLFHGARGRHSEKPAAFYDIVERMSPGPFLDVFARKLRFNWDAWGDEVGAPTGLPTPEEVNAAE